jgi:hypothetical protein
MVRVHGATTTVQWEAAGQRRRTLSLDGAVVMERLLDRQ